MTAEDRNEELSVASGKYANNSSLVYFLYLLLRDHLPAADVESTLRAVLSNPNDQTVFSNGWLAKYASNIADKLKSKTSLNVQFSRERIEDYLGVLNNLATTFRIVNGRMPTKIIMGAKVKEIFDSMTWSGNLKEEKIYNAFKLEPVLITDDENYLWVE